MSYSRALKRVPVNQPSRQNARTKTFAAPLRGLVVNESLVLAQPGGAAVLENYFPTQTGARLRGGSKRHATVGAGLVESFINYRSGSTAKMFAATNGDIYDVTLPADPTVTPVAEVTGQTSNYYSHVQFATAGGEYVIAVNGDDPHWVYDGLTFEQNDPAITTTTSDNFSQVWSFKSRLFFVKKGTKIACYLPVDSIGGVAADFSLAGIFKRGGSLLFGATWSQDSGDGKDDLCVFVSTEGEVAIYQGTDPGDANAWAIVGRYDIAKPMGINGTMQAGGDLLIATIEGIIPLSEVTKKDPAALSMSAVTRAIEPLWRADVFNRNSRPWEVAKWPEKNMAIVSIPPTYTTAPVESRWGFGRWRSFIWGGGAGNVLSQDPYCYVVNLQTGAWAKYTGWDTQCLCYHDGFVYFGTADGRIMQAEATGYDDGVSYVARYCGLFERLEGPTTKHLHQARATWTYGRDFDDRVSFSTEYVVTWPAPPPAAPDNDDLDVWDIAEWDEAVWDTEAGTRVKARWVSIGRTGYTVAPMVQVTCGGVALPDAELVSIDLTYESGAIVV